MVTLTKKPPRIRVRTFPNRYIKPVSSTSRGPLWQARYIGEAGVDPIFFAISCERVW